MDVETAQMLLDRESGELDTLVAGLSPEQWHTPTPSPGWTIADQIAHLHWTDRVATQALTGDPAFTDLVARLAGRGSDTHPTARPAADTEAQLVETFIDEEAHRIADRPAAELLRTWRRGRDELRAAIAAADPAQPTPWFGPPMRPVTMLTARIMETWAHGLDIWDALGREKPATGTLAAVARIGVRTRGFSFTAHGLPAPDAEVRVELSMPTGPDVTAGDETATDRVTGSAWGFAAVVTQRRHPDDVDLTATGPVAKQWLEIAQAFAGAATHGPAAGQRAIGGRR